MERRRTIIVIEFPRLIEVELEIGPLIPASMAWRLFSISKATVYSWLDRGQITKVQVMGVTCVPRKEVLELLEKEK